MNNKHESTTGLILSNVMKFFSGLKSFDGLEWKKAGHAQCGYDKHQTALSAIQTPPVIRELAWRGG